MQPTNRTSTAIDATPVGALAAEYVQRYWQHNPSAATYAGVKGFDHLLDDYGPDNSAMQALDEEFLQRLAATPTATDAERVAAEVFEHELRAELIAHRTGYGMRAWGVITSPASEIRELIELMDTDTPAQRGAVVSRIRQIPRALTQWHELLLSAHRDGNVNSRHATLETIRQFRQIA